MVLAYAVFTPDFQSSIGNLYGPHHFVSFKYSVIILCYVIAYFILFHGVIILCYIILCVLFNSDIQSSLLLNAAYEHIRWLSWAPLHDGWSVCQTRTALTTRPRWMHLIQRPAELRVLTVYYNYSNCVTVCLSFVIFLQNYHHYRHCLHDHCQLKITSVPETAVSRILNYSLTMVSY